MMGICVVFVLLVRGCYNVDYTIDGHRVDNSQVAWYASIVVFQMVCYGMFFMTTLFSMKIFSRDKNDGASVMFLSRPVDRWQYVLGRVTGTWVLCLTIMFALHFIIFIMSWSKQGGASPGFLVASLISSINLLFVIMSVCLFSLLMPDVTAALLCTAIIGVGFVSETGYRLIQSDLFHAMSRGTHLSDAALWRLVYPKINMLQYYADAVIRGSAFQAMGPVHPAVNVMLYILLFAAVLVAVYNKKEVV
jgi:ABC-type transport system involved in multi-copper enzyme maturation permease subunit